MFTRLRQIITSPPFLEEDTTQTTALLTAILWASLAVCGGYTVIALLFDPRIIYFVFVGGVCHALALAHESQAALAHSNMTLHGGRVWIESAGHQHAVLLHAARSSPCRMRNCCRPAREGSLMTEPRSTLRTDSYLPIGRGGSIGLFASSAITRVGTARQPTSSCIICAASGSREMLSSR
jgi:hypothetical protein